MNLQDKLKAMSGEKLSTEKKTGSDFMEGNKNNPGVLQLDGGIQYLIVKEGTGARPQASSKIKAHYKGSLLNGKEFDSSYRRNQPFTAPLNALISGWQQVIPLMPVGSVWRTWIPSNLAYGDRGSGAIPGGATLEFEIELLDILD